jgi:hypothetical protein
MARGGGGEIEEEAAGDGIEAEAHGKIVFFFSRWTKLMLCLVIWW